MTKAKTTGVKTVNKKQNYVIECTVSELTKGSGVAVKIVGSEGYAIKHGDKKYNAFCPKNDMSKPENCNHGYIIDSEIEFTGSEKFENILTQASVHGKKIRLSIELASEDELKKHIQNKTAIPIQSVSLLQK